MAGPGNPPLTWSETKNIKWKVRLPGSGSSTPIVWEDEIFVTTAVPSTDGPRGEYKFNLVCIDRGTGHVKWSRTARAEVPHEGHRRALSAPRPPERSSSSENTKQRVLTAFLFNAAAGGARRNRFCEFSALVCQLCQVCAGIGRRTVWGPNLRSWGKF